MGTVSTTTFTSDTETVTRTKLNGLVANLLTEFNGNIDNSNIKASAGIVGSKLDLASLGAIGSTSPSSGAFTTLSASGPVTMNGTVTIGNEATDALTFHANSWTLSNAVTVTGTWTNLGTVTTIDLNGGTLDGMTIGATSAPTVTSIDINGGTIDDTPIGLSATSTGAFSTLKVGTTNQGDILYDNGTSLVRLTPGTSGQFLKTLGPSANPLWATAVTPYTAGTYIEINASTETTSGFTGSYTKVKELSPLIRSGVINLTWEHKHTGGGSGESKLYINGIAVGTEKTTSSSSYAEVSESNVTVAIGDVLQIYAKITAGSQTDVKNFKLKVAVPTVPLEVA